MRAIRAVLIFLVGAAVSLTLTYVLVVRPRVRGWGVDPAEIELELPGDELIPEPTAIETHGVTIDGPISGVWPYLVQMGFGRAGWYSYDMLDNKGKSAEGIVPEFQHLDAGDVMPVAPGGGFVVKTVDFERSLVLYTDTQTVREQAEKAQAEGTDQLPTSGMKFTGAMTSSYPEFSASWAFYLKPTDDGKTRLIERFRVKTPGNAPANAVLGEVMGTGIILMTRKQMLRIKELVEKPTETPEAEAAAPEVPPTQAVPITPTEPSLAS